MEVSVVEFFKRLIKWDNKLEIYTNGVDNAYPERIERLINNSVTAKTASNIMVQYLLGKGFGDADLLKVGDCNLIDFAEDIAQDIVDHKGFYVHVNYDLNYKPSSFNVIPFNHCRIGKKDSKKYNGKILVSDDWSNKKLEPQIIDVYNTKEAVVKAQIKAAGGIEKYKGQILYYNIENKYHYPNARIDTVQKDCDSEAQSSIYKNTLLRKGFFGKTLIVMPPMVDKQITPTIYNDSQQLIPNPEYTTARSEADEAKKTIESFIGASNAGGAMIMEMEFAGDKLEEALLIKNIESNISPDLFQNVETSVRENILIAYNNLPIDLVKVSSGLSNGGEAVKQNKLMYWENTSKERNILETVINDLLKDSGKYKGEYLTIKTLIEDAGNNINN